MLAGVNEPWAELRGILGQGISVLWILLTNDKKTYIPELILLFCISLILILIYYKQEKKKHIQTSTKAEGSGFNIKICHLQ